MLQQLRLEIVRFNENFHLNFFLWFILGGVFCYSIYMFSLGWNSLVLDIDSYRQAYNTMIVYWMLKEGHYLLYQTPVMGYPWSVPLEFPLYQWAIVLVYKISNLGIEQAGRLVSISCFYLILVPTYFIIKRLNLSLNVYKIFAILFLTSTFYLFWSRTVLMESMTVFLMVSYLALVQAYYLDKKTSIYFLALFVGTLAGLLKITTFFPCLFIVLGIIIFELTKQIRDKKYAYTFILQLLFIIVLPLIATAAWLYYGMQLCNLNDVCKSRTVTELFQYWFGNWNQLLNLYFVLKQIIPEIFGFSSFLVYAFIATKHSDAKETKYALLAFGCMVLGIAIFPGLHINHLYYNYENAYFYILGGAFLLNILLRKKQIILFLIFLVCILLSQSFIYNAVYKRLMNVDYSVLPIYKIALFVKNHTKPDDAILVYYWDGGTPVINYYSERKGLSDPYWGDYVSRLRNINSLIDNKNLGAIIQCPSLLDKNAAAINELNKITRNYYLTKMYDCKIYLPKQ